MSPVAPTPPPVAERTSHPFLTHDMIHEIPAAMRETLRRNEDAAMRIGETLSDRSQLYLTGCGTAFFSAMLAQRLLASDDSERLRSEAAPALEFSAYGPRLDGRCGVLGVSHSGITKATVDALHAARQRGARTVGITHFADRPISAAVDSTLLVGNGPDRSRCHTKCYVAGALGAVMVGWAWDAAAGGASRGHQEDRLSSLKDLPALQDRVLHSAENVCEDLAASHLSRRSTFILGAGPNEPTALEAALKLKESSFIAAEGMELEQFLHGSWQATGPESLVFALAPRGPSRARALDLIRASRAVGAHVVTGAAEGDREVEEASEVTIPVPEVDEALSPFLYILPLYLYAYHASVKRGNNPDLLRYLEAAYWAARQIVFPPGTH